MAYVINRSVSAGILDRGTGVLKSLQDYLRRRAVYRQTLRELNGLTDRELADLGMHRVSLTEIAREAAFGN